MSRSEYPPEFSLPEAPTLAAEIKHSIEQLRRLEKRWYDQFHPIRVWPNNSGGFTIKAQPGFVEEVVPQSGVDCVIHHATLYGGNPHTDDVEIDIPSGSTLVCVVDQDLTGAVGPHSPRLEVHAAVPESSHWYPTDPEGSGAAGTMYFKLYKVEKVDGVARITSYHWGPVVVRNDLWTGENLGTGTGIFKEHAETEGAVYYFRSVEGRYGINDSTSVDGDTIVLDFDAENVGSPTSGGGEVYKEAGGGNTDVPAEFRRLSEGPSGRQEVTVTENGDIIQIMGNAKDGRLIFTDCDDIVIYILNWTDGLVTNEGDWTLKIPECDSFLP